MGKKIHYMLSVDRDSKTGVCKFCGPVKVKLKRSGYLCNNSQRRWNSGKRKNTPDFTALVGTSCEICGSKDRLVPDHSHVTGAFRGTLCRTCNSGIGLLKDDPDVLMKASFYLANKKPAGG